MIKKIATLIIENKKGELLLYLRDNKPGLPYAHHWDLFGGHVEEGESVKEALIREIKEELDYNLTDYKFFKKYDCLGVDPMDNEKYVYTSIIDKDISELKLYEGEKMQFFKSEEIKNLKIASILKNIILDYLKSKE